MNKKAGHPLSPSANVQKGLYYASWPVFVWTPAFAGRIARGQSAFFICAMVDEWGFVVGWHVSYRRICAAAKSRRESWRCTTISELMINEQIRDREIRLIGENGEQLGIMSAREAFKMAQDAELDLVKIAPTAKPPVCKIIDYGKYKYEMLRKEKEARKKQKTTEVKEIRLSPNIDENDLNTKANQARKFITKGDKVKISLRFRGREMAHMNSSREILDGFVEKLSDIAVVDKPAKVEGRSMIVFLSEKR